MKDFILWDHDGVLVDTEPFYYEATREALSALGFDLPLDGYLADMGSGVSAWDRAIAQGVTVAAVEERRAWRNSRYQELLQDRSIEIPGVEEVLAELATDYQMAIVTTARRADFELIHRQRGIVPFMDFVLTVEDYPRAKPAPDSYLAALKRLGARAEQAVVVEDSTRGLRASIAAGIDCVVVDNAFVREQDFTGALARIGSLSELPRLLATL